MSIAASSRASTHVSGRESSCVTRLPANPGVNICGGCTEGSLAIRLMFFSERLAPIAPRNSATTTSGSPAPSASVSSLWARWWASR
jgi:hypothetical protein